MAFVFLRCSWLRYLLLSLLTLPREQKNVARLAPGRSSTRHSGTRAKPAGPVFITTEWEVLEDASNFRPSVIMDSGLLATLGPGMTT